MAPLPTVIRIEVIGVDLPAFLLSKNFVFRVHRNAPGSLGRVWRDLPDRLCMPRACITLNPAVSPSSSIFGTNTRVASTNPGTLGPKN